VLSLEANKMQVDVSVDEHTAIAAGIAAARAGDPAKLQAWLQAGNTPNGYDAEGWTPLLWASARGHGEAVRLLLDAGADINQGHELSQALPVHMAGHSGSVDCARILLEHRPEHLDAVWDLNGHTILLQAVFYDHQELAAFLVQRGADTAITTARGLGPMELAAQFQNQKMMDIIRPYDTPAAAKAAYYETYLARIAPQVPEAERPAQQLSDRLVQVIESGIKQAASDAGAVPATLATVRELVEQQQADVNRLGGALQQPPLVVAVTGNNGFPPSPAVAELRNRLAAYLLEQGADPALHEQHPMGAQTIIRAAVFNHLGILKQCAQYMTPQQLADAINEVPVVNGLTALHDTVLRASTAAPAQLEGYLEQARWFVANGGRSDMEDFSGRTQRAIAEHTQDPAVRRRLLAALET
jgi:ankyrin repeat protein